MCILFSMFRLQLLYVPTFSNYAGPSSYFSRESLTMWRSRVNFTIICEVLCLYLHSNFQAYYELSLGGNSQNFFGKFVRFFITLKCFYRVFIHRKQVLYYLYSCKHHPLMIFASKSTLSLNNLKISRPKVTKNLTNFCKRFCETPRPTLV